MLIVRDAPMTTVGSGGYLRSLQIAELLGEGEHVVVDMLPGAPRPTTWFERRRRARVMRRMAKQATPGENAERMQRKRAAMQYQASQALFDSLATVDLFIWERTARHGSLVAARERGIPSVALCHNLESLVPDEQLSYARKGDAHKRFAAECEQLANTQSRIVISARDQWLLGLFGLDSHYLPYFPPHARRAWLADVRRNRAPSQAPRRLLLMGSAFYGPNLQGMREMLEHLTSRGVLGSRLVVDVAGFGSERLESVCRAPGVVFHGPVSDAQLAHLMYEASAAIVYQNSGGGSLTRVTDYLSAGVSVLANPVAARNHEHESGVHIFEDAEDLCAWVADADFAACATAPAYPERACQRFLTGLDAVCARAC